MSYAHNKWKCSWELSSFLIFLLLFVFYFIIRKAQPPKMLVFSRQFFEPVNKTNSVSLGSVFYENSSFWLKFLTKTNRVSFSLILSMGVCFQGRGIHPALVLRALLMEIAQQLSWIHTTLSQTGPSTALASTAHTWGSTDWLQAHLRGEVAISCTAQHPPDEFLPSVAYASSSLGNLGLTLVWSF